MTKSWDSDSSVLSHHPDQGAVLAPSGDEVPASTGSVTIGTSFSVTSDGIGHGSFATVEQTCNLPM